MFVLYSYLRFDCKINVSLFGIHGPSVFSSILYKSAFIDLVIRQSQYHLTQGTRRGHPCPLDTYLVFPLSYCTFLPNSHTFRHKVDKTEVYFGYFVLIYSNTCSGFSDRNSDAEMCAASIANYSTLL